MQVFVKKISEELSAHFEDNLQKSSGNESFFLRINLSIRNVIFKGTLSC